VFVVSKRRESKNIKVQDTTDGAEHDPAFEAAFSLVDSVFTAALISGVSSVCIQSALSYGFLQVAAERRGISDKAKQDWYSNPELIWKPVIAGVLQVIGTFDGVYDLDEINSELDFLLDQWKITPGSLSEFEERRHSKISFLLLHQCLENLSRQHADAHDVELAFLVEWLKVSMISGECAIETYAIVRYNAETVQASYNQNVF